MLLWYNALGEGARNVKTIFAACVVLAVSLLIAGGGIAQNPQWKGTIEEKER